MPFIRARANCALIRFNFALLSQLRVTEDSHYFSMEEMMSLVSPLRTYSACFRFYFLLFRTILSPTPPISFPFASIRLRFYCELFYSFSASFPHPFTVPVLFYRLRTSCSAYFISFSCALLIFTPIRFAPLAITFYSYSDDFHIISHFIALCHSMTSGSLSSFSLIIIELTPTCTIGVMELCSFYIKHLSVVSKTRTETHSSFPPQS